MSTTEQFRSSAERRKYRLPEIDGLRAVACLMILIYHSWEFTNITRIGRWISPLTAGVDLFIVLSGFCLFLPVATAPARFSTRRFWTGRIRRIVPAYYASMLYVIALPVLLVGAWRIIGRPAAWQPMPSLGQWAAHLTFTHMFSTHTWDGINGSYWSLGLEAEFYVAMPLVVWLFRRFGVRGLLVPAAISLAWNIVTIIVFWGQGFSAGRFLWEASLPGRWLEFTGGAFAAYVVHRTRTGQFSLTKRTRDALSGTGLIFILAVLYVVPISSLPIAAITLLPTGAVALLIGVSAMPHAEPTLPARVLRFSALRALGTISYSFYLLHQPTEWYLSQLLKTYGINGVELWTMELTLGAAIIAVLATGSWLAFERRVSIPRRPSRGASVTAA